MKYYWTLSFLTRRLQLTILLHFVLRQWWGNLQSTKNNFLSSLQPPRELKYSFLRKSLICSYINKHLYDFSSSYCHKQDVKCVKCYR